MTGKRPDGFLLLEALISLSLLAAGLLICMDTFSLAQRAIRRSEGQVAAARCAEKKLLELSLNVAVGELDCPQTMAWSNEVRPLSRQFDAHLFHVAWQDNDRSYEETFETIQRAR